MRNSEIIKSIETYQKNGYKLYLRSESLKRILDSKYNVDKSITAYFNSKFYSRPLVDYSEYVSESIDKTISYADYVSEYLNNVISYSEYISEKI